MWQQKKVSDHAGAFTWIRNFAQALHSRVSQKCMKDNIDPDGDILQNTGMNLSKQWVEKLIPHSTTVCHHTISILLRRY